MPSTGNSTEAEATSYPVERTTRTRSSGFTRRGSNRTVARAVAKFTSARATPSSPRSPFWMLAAQEAQLMPEMGRSSLSRPAAVSPLDDSASGMARPLPGAFFSSESPSSSMAVAGLCPEVSGRR